MKKVNFRFFIWMNPNVGMFLSAKKLIKNTDEETALT